MIWLIIAIISLLVGHLVKLYRWRLFIEIYESPSISVLLKSLSVAHAINFVIPFHVGDIYRIIYSGKHLANGIKFSLSTVVIEHYIDLIVLAGICSILFVLGHNTIGTMVMFAAIASTIILLTIVTMHWNHKTKIYVVEVAEIFNPRIELSILGMVWTFVSIFKQLVGAISKSLVIVSTIFMWLSYMFSYWCFAEALQSVDVNIRLREVVDILFSPRSILNESIYNSDGQMYLVVSYCSIYILIPLVLIYIASFFYDDQKNEDNSIYHHSIIPHVNANDALFFLETFFKGNIGGAYLKGFLEVNKDVNIMADYSAGSNAVTLLCTDGTTTFFRKFAIGDDGKKLYNQVKWIKEHQRDLNLAQILTVRKEKDYCSYDMVYNESAEGLFTYMHTHTAEQTWIILHHLLVDLDVNLYKNKGVPKSEMVSDYIEKKVTNNLKKIIGSTVLRGLLKYEKLIINGNEYHNLPYYYEQLSDSKLSVIFRESTACDVHGDLTIENIIYQEGSYYLIDPNPENILNSSDLDWGKLLQSLHGGYEFLMRIHDFSVRGNQIDFVFIRSMVYDYLHQQLSQYIISRYGIKVMKTTYYHEIVHWLRLIPYKLNQLGEGAVVFYAGLIMVLNDIEKMDFNDAIE